MKKYKIIGKIVLSFIIDDEQHDLLISHGPTDKYLEATDTTVWYITPDGQKLESITTANVIDVALARGDIKEIF
jgi:hypothetical protein